MLQLMCNMAHQLDQMALNQPRINRQESNNGVQQEVQEEKLPPASKQGNNMLENARNQEFQERLQEHAIGLESVSSSESYFQRPSKPTQEARQQRGEQKTRENSDFKLKIDLPSLNVRKDIEAFLDWIKNG